MSDIKLTSSFTKDEHIQASKVLATLDDATSRAVKELCEAPGQSRQWVAVVRQLWATMEDLTRGYDSRYLSHKLIGHRVSGLVDRFLDGVSPVDAVRWYIERRMCRCLDGLSNWQIESGHPQFQARMLDYLYAGRRSTEELSELAGFVRRGGWTSREAMYFARQAHSDATSGVVTLGVPRRLREIDRNSAGT